MKSSWISFVSTLGLPVLGLLGLVFCLWHASPAAGPSAATGQELMFLQEPSSRLDRSMAICLKQQALQVTRSRARMQPEGIAEAVADYNLVAQECTPAVFAVTHLPASQAL